MKFYGLLLIYLIAADYSLADTGTKGQQLQCMNGKIRYVKMGKEIQEDSAYCFDDSRTRLVSKSCYEDKSHCYAWQKNKKTSQNFTAGETGSPGFQKCLQLGGSPMQISFYDGKEWFPLDRCQFKVDNSFVNSAFLFRLGQKE